MTVETLEKTTPRISNDLVRIVVDNVRAFHDESDEFSPSDIPYLLFSMVRTIIYHKPISEGVPDVIRLIFYYYLESYKEYYEQDSNQSDIEDPYEIYSTACHSLVLLYLDNTEVSLLRRLSAMAFETLMAKSRDCISNNERGNVRSVLMHLPTLEVVCMSAIARMKRSKVVQNKAFLIYAIDLLRHASIQDTVDFIPGYPDLEEVKRQLVLKRRIIHIRT